MGPGSQLADANVRKRPVIPCEVGPGSWLTGAVRLPILGVKEAAVNFVAGNLKSDPVMAMRELQEIGARLGINVNPLIMEPAKKRLGMGRPKSSARKPSAARRVSRESASKSNDPSSLVNNFVAHMKRLGQENQTLRATLKQIASLVR
jgi:hypothetical protein